MKMSFMQSNLGWRSKVDSIFHKGKTNKIFYIYKEKKACFKAQDEQILDLFILLHSKESKTLRKLCLFPYLGKILG